MGLQEIAASMIAYADENPIRVLGNQMNDPKFEKQIEVEGKSLMIRLFKVKGNSSSFYTLKVFPLDEDAKDLPNHIVQAVKSIFLSGSTELDTKLDAKRTSRIRKFIKAGN